MFKLFNLYRKMVKKNIHPKWFQDTKVYCDGQLVMIVSSTKPELFVDIWSGNHPFYTGSQRIIDTEGRVERFFKKYDLEEPK
jgi:large subunit ribosomal protein L31